jgi:hypothetical protein
MEVRMKTDTPFPIDVMLTDTKITIVLSDGREISNPLDWFPWLKDAPKAQQDNYELWHFSIDWPDLDNGIDIEGMLQGIRPHYRLTP